MLLTIFTPVYNRAYIISQLYESLCRQTCKDFEWLVVDDGSTDNIDKLMNKFISESKINIRYFKQPNGGKHRAINRGVREASGELFFIVDSDDHLTDDAVDWISRTYCPIKTENSLAGLSGIRIRPNGDKIGGGTDFGSIDANALDIRYKYHITGDLAEIFKTDILRVHPFPEFDGERFCPEALVWNRIARTHSLRYCYKGIYVCEYRPDGLTAKITSIRHKSPKASVTFYSELYHSAIPLAQKMKAAINFWRFSGLRRSIYHGHKMLNPLSTLAIIPGLLFRLKDKN